MSLSPALPNTALLAHFRSKEWMVRKGKKVYP